MGHPPRLVEEASVRDGKGRGEDGAKIRQKDRISRESRERMVFGGVGRVIGDGHGEWVMETGFTKLPDTAPSCVKQLGRFRR